MFEWKELSEDRSYELSSHDKAICCKAFTINGNVYAEVKIGTVVMMAERGSLDCVGEAKTWCEQTALEKARKLVGELMVFVEEVEK